MFRNMIDKAILSFLSHCSIDLPVLFARMQENFDLVFNIKCISYLNTLFNIKRNLLYQMLA